MTARTAAAIGLGADATAIERVEAALEPARLQIIEQFSGCRPRTVHDIVADSNLAQSTVSEHLRILRDAEGIHVAGLIVPDPLADMLAGAAMGDSL